MENEAPLLFRTRDEREMTEVRRQRHGFYPLTDNNAGFVLVWRVVGWDGYSRSNIPQRRMRKEGKVCAQLQASRWVTNNRSESLCLVPERALVKDRTI